MTILLPRPINRYAFVSTYLFSSTAYGLIPISGPFIPTISKFHSSTPRKKGILIFGNHPSHSYVISFCAGVFSIAKRHAPDASTSRMLQHLLHMAPYPPPRSTVWWRSYGGEILWWFGRELSRLLFPFLYILLEDFGCSTFCIFNSQEPVRGALPHFRKFL